MTNTNRDQYNGTLSSISNSNFFYFLVGGGIGAAVALLFAPKTGVELRTDISDLTKKGYEETVDLAHQLKEQSSEVYKSVKEKTGKVYDLAASKWSHLSELPSDLINESLEAVENNTSQKKANGRGTASIH